MSTPASEILRIMPAAITRTVMNGLEHSTYVSIDSIPIVPDCITRFGVGSRVEVRKLPVGAYAVQALPGDIMRVFGEETWHGVTPV